MLPRRRSVSLGSQGDGGRRTTLSATTVEGVMRIADTLPLRIGMMIVAKRKITGRVPSKTDIEEGIENHRSVERVGEEQTVGTRVNKGDGEKNSESGMLRNQINGNGRTKIA